MRVNKRLIPVLRKRYDSGLQDIRPLVRNLRLFLFIFEAEAELDIGMIWRPATCYIVPCLPSKDEFSAMKPRNRQRNRKKVRSWDIRLLA